MILYQTILYEVPADSVSIFVFLKEGFQYCMLTICYADDRDEVGQTHQAFDSYIHIHSCNREVIEPNKNTATPENTNN